MSDNSICSVQNVTPEATAEARASFYGLYLAVLAYGALLMLYVQLTGILIARPSRGRSFWLVLAYSIALFPLATVAIGPILKFSEESYIEQRNCPPFTYFQMSSSYLIVIGEVSATLLAWVADILMLTRLWIIWNSSVLIMVVPVSVYLARLAVSIPVFIAVARVEKPAWSFNISTAYHSLTLAFNIYMTCIICLRLRMLRPKLEAVGGKICASFYTSNVTTFVESGGFFTIWGTVFLILRSRDSLFQWAFFFPIPFIMGVTRILIVLRLAQDRAWSKDLVDATHHGILDWQISSTHSIPLYDVPSTSDYPSPDRIENKVRKQMQSNFMP